MANTELFQDQRRNTDDSLGAERNKTNESILDAHSRAEQKTDRVVEKRRVEADQATSSARTETDSLSNESHSEKLKSERSQNDRSIELERNDVDAAIEREREAKNRTVANLLTQERGETDENLSLERAETDSEVDRASGRLSVEVAEHSKTRGTLTSREEFIAIVSHDLRNPIGAASSCAEMLLEDSAYKEMEPESIKYWIEFIKRNVDTSLRLISDLLDMERIAKDKLQLKVAKHDVDSIIRESIESFAYLASAKTILLRSSSPKMSGSIVCDRDRILQVLSNLIGNALKFTPEGGSVTVATERTPNGTKIFVKDTGPGIPLEKRSQLFERFTQLQSSDRRGLGLGLYISKMIVEAHGGEIGVHSELDKGSSFYFTIPFSPSETVAHVH